MAIEQGILSDKLWTDPVVDYSNEDLHSFCSKLDISTEVGMILASRNRMDAEGAFRFLNPQAGQLHDPWLLRGMDTTVDRLLHAILHYQKIFIFGDNDVDGTASTALLYGYLKAVGGRVHYFIPDRLRDGFSLHPDTAQRLVASKAELVVTVDNGSGAVDGVDLLRRNGIDTLITDHHQVPPMQPAALAMVNPQHPDCRYPFKDLSAAGVAYKIIKALHQHCARMDVFSQRGITPPNPDYNLDLVALATVADMSPLVGENRILVRLGFEMMEFHPRPGLVGLLKECNVRGGISPRLIHTKIAPKINAMGRVGDPSIGVKLLLTHSYGEGRRLSRILCDTNRKRQEIEGLALALSEAQVAEQMENPAFVLVGKDWHPGILGILASRIASQYNKPTVVLTQHHGEISQGSARGVEGFDLLSVLKSCEGLLDRFGGHTNAAGLALPSNRLDAFARRFQAATKDCRDSAGRQAKDNPSKDKLAIDTWVNQDHFTRGFVEEISRLSPFGFGNPEPVVALRDVSLEKPMVLNSRHLKFQVSCHNGPEVEAFGWDAAQHNLDLSRRYDLALAPQVSQLGDSTRTTFRLVDVRSA
ncbi:MAG: single-stranded-DNA-specific exonuclease RecJ [Deltaproteobacteria bacterium]|nr:single-stranded-DNA-specific exonuclease RecJ [Deltaproteobacteria bacterium]